MKKQLTTKALFGLCYAFAALAWLAYCLLGSAVMLYHKSAGELPTKTLTAGELQFESFVNYNDLEWQTAPDDDPNWYLSTDNDPQILWTSGDAPVYIETVRLNAAHRLPAGSVVLYYLRPGQTDYSEAQKIVGAVSGEGQYTFDLGGKMVVGLRIDPDSVGGVPTNFTGITLNPTTLWFMRFVPGGGGWLLLLGLPALAAAVLAQLAAALTGAAFKPLARKRQK